jgi:protein-arginine kinase activator protein McsA
MKCKNCGNEMVHRITRELNGQIVSIYLCKNCEAYCSVTYVKSSEVFRTKEHTKL